MVAAQPVLGLVQHHEGGAARAIADPAAGVARNHGGVAAPVQKQQRLLAAFQAQAQRGDHLGGQAVAPAVALHVDQAHARQHRILHGALAQVEPLVAPRARVVPRFERRRGRAQHDRDAQLVRAPDSQVTRRIAQAFLLLVRRVVFFVDHDQLQVRQRRQQRKPRTEHDARLAQVRRQPVQHALALGQAAVQRGEHHAREARPDIAFELRREVDLGDHDQDLRLWIARQHLGAGLQIDLGLAAAGDAP